MLCSVHCLGHKSESLVQSARISHYKARLRLGNATRLSDLLRKVPRYPYNRTCRGAVVSVVNVAVLKPVLPLNGFTTVR